MTGDPRRWASEPGMPGVVHFWGPYLYRSPFHATTEAEECERALQHLDDTIMVEGPGTVAAIILETVVGTNGILVPPDGYLAGVRDICDRYGIVMIADEVMAGFGRCGEWFAIDRWDVTPDLICFAKGVNSGYVPLGGVIISQRIADTFAELPYPGGLTYSGHPLACAASVASIKVFEEEGIIEHARMLERDVHRTRPAATWPSATRRSARSAASACSGPSSCVKDRRTREPLVPFNAAGPAAAPMKELFGACAALGLWPFVHFNRLHVVPPVTITPDDAREGIALLDEALKVADAHSAG